MKHQRLIGLLLAVLLALSVCPTAFAAQTGLGNFQKENNYTPGLFSDVPEKEWYAANVRTAYELGLVQGSYGRYDPNGNITIAQAITMACRMHSIYHGGSGTFVQGTPWYQVYVDYALQKGMIRAGQFADYNKPATRAQFAVILSAALPDEALPVINTVTTLPDVHPEESHGAAVYRLYRAGVLSGNDAYGTFTPRNSITRAEAAAILSRMVQPSLRKTLALKVKDPIPPTGVDVSIYIGSSQLKVGQTLALDVRLRPEGAASALTWRSSDPTVASVDDQGVVTAHKAGQVTISAAAYNGVTGTLRTPLTVTGTGGVLQYALTADGTGYEITGCSADAFIAHIQAVYNGLPVKAIRGGAFMNCTKLHTFTVDAGHPVFTVRDGVLFSGRTLVCFPPAWARQSYYAVPADVTAAAPYAFAGIYKGFSTSEDGIESVIFPEGFTTLGDYAFAGADNINLRLFMPKSLTQIGKNLLQGQKKNVAFYGDKTCAARTYAQQNNIPFGILTESEPPEMTARTAVPERLDGDRAVPFTGQIKTLEGVYDAGFYTYKTAHINRYLDLSAAQQGFSGEVRLPLTHVWNKIVPDVNGKTQKEFPEQSGLYGAGYTEGDAILRAYDRSGRLMAMQYISGDFSFAFPGAFSLGVEGGKNTALTVLPVEPVYVTADGTLTLQPDAWHKLADGNVFQYFVLEFPQATFAVNMPSGANNLTSSLLDAASEEQPESTDHYQILWLCSKDASRVSRLQEVSVTLDGMAVLFENEEFLCLMADQFQQTETFGQKAYDVFKQVKTTMVGTYYPTEWPVHQVTLIGNGRYPGSSGGVIDIDGLVIEDFDILALTHEMVHAVDQSVACVGKVPPPAWSEGRAEYISRKACDALGVSYWDYKDTMDWSFLSAADKADFFHYYYFSTNQETSYTVGYYFFKYLCETYGEDVSARITANLAALTEYSNWAGDESCAPLFKQCVEAATEPGVFQNFVRDVINR